MRTPSSGWDSCFTRIDYKPAMPALLVVMLRNGKSAFQGEWEIVFFLDKSLLVFAEFFHYSPFLLLNIQS